MARIGNANVAIVPIEMDDDYHLTFPRNPTFMGFMERHFHTYDCADFPNNDAPPDIKVPYKFIADVPHKNGGTDRLATHRQFNRFRSATGFKNYTDAARLLDKDFDFHPTPFPAPSFEPVWNDHEKVEIRYRPFYRTFVVRISKPGARAYGHRLFVLAIPVRVHFLAYIRGYCGETPKSPPRGIVIGKSVPAGNPEDPWWDMIFRNQANKDKKNRYYRKVYTSQSLQRRFKEVWRYQLRGIPKRFH